MASTFTVKRPRVVGHVQSLPLATRHGGEGAGQTWVKGDIVINSSGTLVITTDNPDAQVIVGMVHQAASTVTATSTPFTPLTQGTILEINLSDADGVNYVMVAGDMFTSFALGIASGVCFLDTAISQATAGQGEKLFAMVIGFARDRLSTGAFATAAVGDTDARVLAVVTNSAWSTGISTTAAS